MYMAGNRRGKSRGSRLTMVIQGNSCVFWYLGMSNIISIADTIYIHHICMCLKAFLWVPGMGQPWAMVTEAS